MLRSGPAVWLLVSVAACAAPKPPPPAPAPKPPAAVNPAPAPARDTTRVDSAARVGAARVRGPRASVRLAFVGDINLGTMTLPGGVPPDSGRRFLAAAQPALAGDLVVGNFEGVLADSGETEKCGKRKSVAWTGVFTPPDTSTTAPPPRPHERRRHQIKRAKAARKPPPVQCYAFLTPTLLAPRLSEAGFTHLNLANNHANDFGPDGRRSTESILSALGLQLYGPLGRISVDTVHRGNGSTIVGVIGFTTYPFAYDLLDIDRSVAVVDSLRRIVDLLIVTFHGGTEGSAALHLPFAAESLGHEPRGDLRAWAHAVVDAGADIVVGHGPHVLRGLEYWKGKLIAYSLGNFATYRGFNLSGPQGLTGVLQLEFDAGGALVHARLAPMRQHPFEGPAPDPDGAAVRLVRDLSSDDFGVSAARISDDGTIAPP